MLEKALDVDIEMHQVYSRIRNYLAGRVIGITRDKTLLHEVVKCLFCKVKFSSQNIDVSNEPAEQIALLYRREFLKLKVQLPHIFDDDEEILLDPSTIQYVDKELSYIDLTNPSKDPLGELYQSFISSDLRMAEGQFFTPHQAIAWLVEAIEPKPGEKIIDPACGPGGFLSYSARYLLNKGVERDIINDSLYGIEKDSYLAKLANAHIALVTLKKSNIFCADSIEWKTEGGEKLNIPVENSYDIVLANPPFGAKIKVGSEEVRRKFELAHKWSVSKDNGKLINTNVLKANTPPQILFIELCLSLLKPGGRMGVVVPESMISNSSTSYVVQFIRDHAEINAVCGMPESLFKTSGKGGTHTKTCLLIATKRNNKNNSLIFMAEAKWCGHDSRGNSIPHNDLPHLLRNYQNGILERDFSNLGYYINDKNVIDNILAPRYYDPDSQNEIDKLESTHDIVTIQSLVDKGVIEFSTGDEIGKLAYGTGTIPFVRTSDITNWEIKIDPKQGVSEEIYTAYAKKQDVKEGDILMVRDGTYLIGSCGYISKYDEKIIYQSHLYKIRVRKKEVMSPFLLLALLSCDPVVKQIKAKRFTQDIIDTLGKRVYELQLPIPRSREHRHKIEQMVKKSIEERIEARELARRAKVEIIFPLLDI
ncbi:N-6 DNA methylase [Hafnia alvei]|uniref:N-6 DNA methylase n=1 Tax=Proteus vulgaris TaxID=585 RepID=UPI00299DDF43|nr:N-6 DNA methylase [Proteus vulgaris]WOO48767.1 N-6 DNA methylase [Hafnia alvei]WPF03233.1 N-6 DNA methylase [Proteus vulgaris]